jgi:hypothetical protein
VMRFIRRLSKFGRGIRTDYSRTARPSPCRNAKKECRALSSSFMDGDHIPCA